MVIASYLLCALAAAACAVLLARSYRRTGARLLLWSSLSFWGFAVVNGVVTLDVLTPGVDLMPVRGVVLLISVALLLYGLVWEVRS